MSDKIKKVEAELERLKAEAKLATVTTEFQAAIDGMHHKAAEYVTKWVKENEGKVAAETVAALNHAKSLIVAKMIGMKEKWGGEWEVEYTNGRGSSVSDFIKGEVQADVQKWLADTFKNLPKLSEAQKKTVEAEYKREFTAALNEAIKEKAKRDAEIMADHIILPYKYHYDLGARKIDITL